MTCRFSHISYGEKVTLNTTGNANCQNCGADVRAVSDGKAMIYRGCIGGVDMFDFVTPFNCPSCGKRTTGHAEYCEGLRVPEMEVAITDGLTADDRNTFADCVEDALMHEHPANVAQRIEKEIDAELPYQRDLKRWEHRIVFDLQKSEARLKWEADYRQKRTNHRAGFVKKFYGGR